MAKPFYGDDSPIAALATPPGESALALIRCSGPGCVALLSTVFSRPAGLRSAEGNRIVHGWILKAPPEGGDGGPPLDEVLVSVYRAPKSYTGEEGADISCHGGAATVRAVLGALRAAGFRESLPGEFSFRAFMNGKLDLTRSESVMELVKAKTDTGREHAVGRLSGGLQREIAALNRRLVEVLAETELHLDYDEEELELPEETAEWLPGRGRVQDILGALGALAGAWDRERLYQEGALAVIAGRPNAGKSSLFNALVGEDRSIVTEIPGTTRDWIEALISVEGIPLRLADTAGLRDAGEEDLPAPDRVEQIGVERSRELLGRADLVLYVIDGVRGPDAADLAFFRARAGDSRPPILLWSKADLSPWPERWNGPLAAPLPVSAKTGEGLADLCRAVAGSLEGGAAAAEPGTGGPIREPLTGLGSGRQKELVDRARTALGEALELADRREPLDLIAPPLREAVNALGEITGEVSTADILETIFSTFCVGK